MQREDQSCVEEPSQPSALTGSSSVLSEELAVGEKELVVGEESV